MADQVNLEIKIDTTKFVRAMRKVGISFRRYERSLFIFQCRKNPALDPNHPRDKKILEALGSHPEVLGAISDA